MKERGRERERRESERERREGERERREGERESAYKESAHVICKNVIKTEKKKEKKKLKKGRECAATTFINCAQYTKLKKLHQIKK